MKGDLNTNIELPSFIRYFLGLLVVIAGSLFSFLGVFMLTLDKTSWPYPTAGIVLAICLFVFGLWILYFSLRLFKKRV